MVRTMLAVAMWMVMVKEELAGKSCRFLRAAMASSRSLQFRQHPRRAPAADALIINVADDLFFDGEDGLLFRKIWPGRRTGFADFGVDDTGEIRNVDDGATATGVECFDTDVGRIDRLWSTCQDPRHAARWNSGREQWAVRDCTGE